MDVVLGDLIDALRGQGHRITKARRAICQALTEDRTEHLTAADLHRKASELFGGEIDPSTVYRTLDVLGEIGLLHHVHLGHGPGIVHVSRQPDHHHLVCEKCGRSIDLAMSELAELFDELGRRYGFIPDSAHFAMIGTCSACADPGT